jgi:hypothetical protein
VKVSRNPAERVLAAAFAYEGARAVQTAVLLGFFDRLTPRGRDARAVASACGTHPGATAILLDALVGLGLLRKGGARYTLAPDAARHFVSRSPHSLCDLILHAAFRYPEWAGLPYAVLTGKPVRQHDMFQHRREETRAFIRGMHNLAMARGDALKLPRLVDLSRARTLVDLGGGPATYAIQLCKAYPRLRATLLDYPGSLAIAREYVARARLGRRIALRRANRRLLARVHGALAPGGIVIIKDHLMDRSLTRPPGGALFALTMLMYTRGRCYGLHEIRGWLAEAGFSRGVKRRVPGTSAVAILIARKGGPHRRRS